MRGENWKREEKIVSSSGGGNALQKKEQKKTLPVSGKWSEKLWIQQDFKNKACMYRGGAWVHETTVGIISTARSSRSHRRQKDRIQWLTTTWFTSLFLWLKRWKFRMRRQQWTREWKKLETSPAWQLDKVRSKKEERDKKQVHFATFDGHLSPQKCGVTAKISEVRKERVVLRGDIVKDDSGACAVFTEQGSSASQMTAASVTDVMARPDCAGQAADAVSAYTQVKMEDAPS